MLLTFEQARQKIIPRILSQKTTRKPLTQWLENAIKSAKIERNDALINKIIVRTEGTQE